MDQRLCKRPPYLRTFSTPNLSNSKPIVYKMIAVLGHRCHCKTLQMMVSPMLLCFQRPRLRCHHLIFGQLTGRQWVPSPMKVGDSASLRQVFLQPQQCPVVNTVKPDVQRRCRQEQETTCLLVQDGRQPILEVRKNVHG